MGKVHLVVATGSCWEAKGYNVQPVMILLTAQIAGEYSLAVTLSRLSLALKQTDLVLSHIHNPALPPR